MGRSLDRRVVVPATLTAQRDAAAAVRGDALLPSWQATRDATLLLDEAACAKRAPINWRRPVIHEGHSASERGYLRRLDNADTMHKPCSAGRAPRGVMLAILDDEGDAVPVPG